MRLKTMTITFIIFLLTMLSSCINTSQEDLEIEVTIEFEEQITIGESELMKVYSTLDTDTFTFKSSDESILNVDNEGLVLGLNIGKATITISSSSGKVIHHTVTVIPILYVESISLILEAQDTYYAGVSYNYDINYFPKNAVNKSIKFSSANPNVIIDERDQTITFIKAGEAYIFVYLEDEWDIQFRVDVDVKYDSDTSIYDLLFVGNSLTKYTYNIPLMVKNMIENDGSIVYVDYSTTNS